MSRAGLFYLALSSVAVASCGGGSTSDYTPVAELGQPIFRLPGKASSTPIKHVVIIVEENRSFDNLFNGYPGANTVRVGKVHTGGTVPLTPINLLTGIGTSHDAFAFLADYDNGKMDGFDLNPQGAKPRLDGYTYVEESAVQPYWAIAGQYVLADNFFTSHIDASFVAHQYIIAAQANHAVNLPYGSWGCNGVNSSDLVTVLNPDRTINSFESPCFDYKTLGDELDKAGLTWRFYAPCLGASCTGGNWSSYQAVNHIFNGSDWSKDVISPETTILTDVPKGILANVTWVVPTDANSDHPGMGNGGPSWVASIVNAIGKSQFWDSTVIFVTWDEWGGEYDHVPPPYKDYDGDGFRVPLLCISPYAYAGKVDHTQMEVGGILHFAEETFGLATLSAADARATPAGKHCLNLSQKPRKFMPFAAPYGPNYFLHVQKRDNRPSDDE